MVVKQSKNLYSWRGSGHLLDTLAKLRVREREREGGRELLDHAVCVCVCY